LLQWPPVIAAGGDRRRKPAPGLIKKANTFFPFDAANKYCLEWLFFCSFNAKK